MENYDLSKVVKIAKAYGNVRESKRNWNVWHNWCHFTDKPTLAKETLDVITKYRKEVPQEVQDELANVEKGKNISELEQECKKYLKSIN